MFVNGQTADCVHLFCRSAPTEYVDDEVSVSAQGGARALATDFPSHLLVRGLDKLALFYALFCVQFLNDNCDN